MKSWLQLHIFDQLKKIKLSNQANPLPSSSKLSVFVVPLGNSECITGNVEVRRSRAGKSKGKKDLSNQKSIWWISAAETWQSGRRWSKRGKRSPKRARKSASMRAAKNDDSGTLIFFLQLVIFYSHMLGCNSSPMCTDRKGKTGNRKISNTAASAHRDVSSWETFPATNYAEILVFYGPLKDSELSHANLLCEYIFAQVDTAPTFTGDE